MTEIRIGAHDTPEEIERKVAAAFEPLRGFRDSLVYRCREPIGHGLTCNEAGLPIDKPPTPDRTVLCAQHRLGWGREL